MLLDTWQHISAVQPPNRKHEEEKGVGTPVWRGALTSWIKHEAETTACQWNRMQFTCIQDLSLPDGLKKIIFDPDGRCGSDLLKCKRIVHQKDQIAHSEGWVYMALTIDILGPCSTVKSKRSSVHTALTQRACPILDQSADSIWAPWVWKRLLLFWWWCFGGRRPKQRCHMTPPAHTEYGE